MKLNLQNLFKVALRRSVSLQVTTPRICSRYKHKSTLGRSYVLMEDGVEITELPWIVKRLEAFELPSIKTADSNTSSNKNNHSNNKKGFKYSNNNNNSNNNKIIVKWDEVLFRMLQDCTTAEQIIKLLEIGEGEVTGETATATVTTLQSSTQQDLNSLLQPVILQQLCESIIKDIKTLSNQSIISLIGCCLSSKLLGKELTEAVEEELEGRVVLSYFSVNQLCSLLTSLSESTHADPELIKVFWIHLGNRFGDINESNIGNVFKVLRNLPPDSRYLVKMVDKQLQVCCSRLQADDISTISTQLCLLNYYSGRTFSLLGRWLYANVHNLNTAGMVAVLGLYNHFNVTDNNLQKALEKFVSAFARRTVRGGNLTTPRTLLRMAADFCNNRRFASPVILDAIASDFAHPSSLSHYDLMDGLTVLKSFGQLSYLPSNSPSFFQATEQWLELHLNHLNLPNLLELLASFIYIERYPVNFVDRVLNTHTPAFLIELDDSSLRNKASRHLLEIQASYLLEFPTRSFITLVHNNSLNLSLTWISGRAYKFQKEMAVVMRAVMGYDNFIHVHVPRNTPHLINFEFTVDQNKDVLKENVKNIDATKHAVLLVMPEHTTLAGALMGEHVMKKRHLEKLGYVTVLLSYEEMMWKCKSLGQRVSHLRSILKPYINLQP